MGSASKNICTQDMCAINDPCSQTQSPANSLKVALLCEILKSGDSPRERWTDVQKKCAKIVITIGRDPRSDFFKLLNITYAILIKTDTRSAIGFVGFNCLCVGKLENFKRDLSDRFGESINMPIRITGNSTLP